MTRRGRPSNVIPTIDWKCHVPIPIAAKVDVFLLDPLSGKTRHGARSALVTQLLIQWLQSKGVNTNISKGGDSDALQGKREEAAQEVTG